MAEYQLYCFAQSGNAYRNALMLNLIGADWEPIYALKKAVNVPVIGNGDITCTQDALDRIAAEAERGAPRDHEQPTQSRKIGDHLVDARRRHARLGRQRGTVGFPAVQRDRKSTRLNSSH